jgi:hypothetical protein
MTSRPLFRPTAQQTCWLITLGFLAVGYALYMRYMAIELTSVGLTCQAGAQTWLCSTRQFVMVLFNNSVFGWVALAAALLNLIRPSLFLFGIALAAGAAGVVLYNAGLAGLALALLIVSFARPASIGAEED